MKLHIKVGGLCAELTVSLFLASSRPVFVSLGRKHRHRHADIYQAPNYNTNIVINPSYFYIYKDTQRNTYNN